MSDALERDDVIELLNKLGSERDEDALAAARTLHTRITEAEMSWQDLLVSDDDPVPDEPEVDYDLADEDDEPDSPEPAATFVADESETLALIEKLLARDSNSETFREELEEYKIDLANGDFEPSDHHYVQALYARLSKSR